MTLKMRTTIKLQGQVSISKLITKENFTYGGFGKNRLLPLEIKVVANTTPKFQPPTRLIDFRGKMDHRSKILGLRIFQIADVTENLKTFGWLSLSADADQSPNQDGKEGPNKCPYLPDPL